MQLFYLSISSTEQTSSAFYTCLRPNNIHTKIWQSPSRDLLNSTQQVYCPSPKWISSFLSFALVNSHSIVITRSWGYCVVTVTLSSWQDLLKRPCLWQHCINHANQEDPANNTRFILSCLPQSNSTSEKKYSWPLPFTASAVHSL